MWMQRSRNSVKSTVFNNAGIEGITANVEDYPTETFEMVFNVNVKGAFLGLKYVVPVMKSQGYGDIVNTSSGAGLIGSPGFVGYNSSKHAVIGMTKVVALKCSVRRQSECRSTWGDQYPHDAPN